MVEWAGSEITERKWELDIWGLKWADKKIHKEENVVKGVSEAEKGDFGG